jgi:hypothetical protein
MRCLADLYIRTCCDKKKTIFQDQARKNWRLRILVARNLKSEKIIKFDLKKS